jgi:xylulose-5-phosphate/fructose-6-phosphate phosphoketolase
MANPLSPDLLHKIDAYSRAANYLSVGQIYLKDNPLLETPLTMAHIKPRLLGHWGTTPGLNFLYVHLNRLIKDNDLTAINEIFDRLDHGDAVAGGAGLRLNGCV